MATILLVDDEQMIQDLLTMVLSAAGHTVLAASNGLEAISLFRSSPASFDLVLTDLQMPIMDGHEFVKLLRETRRDIRVICMTGYSAQEFPPNVHHLFKPFVPSKLRECVDNTLESAVKGC